MEWLAARLLEVVDGIVSRERRRCIRKIAGGEERGIGTPCVEEESKRRQPWKFKLVEYTKHTDTQGMNQQDARSILYP